MTLDPILSGRRRSPPAGWEAHLLIAVFSDGRDPKWCKIQLFSGAARGGGWCVSAVEGMNGAAEELVLLGHGDRVERFARAPASGEPRRAADRWELRTSNLLWRGAPPELKLAIAEPRIVARTRTPHVVRWAALGDALSYASAIGSVDWNGRSGVALVEHAWGAESPVDLSFFSPRRWQWDVLVTGEARACAGLSLGAASFGVPAGGGLVGDGALRRGRGLVVRDVAWSRAGDRRVPERWSATLRLEGGAMRYAARRTTPVAETFPKGGYLGFEWEGAWHPDDDAPRPMRGAGFGEYRAP